MGKGLRFLLRLFQHTFETHPEAFRNRLYIEGFLSGLEDCLGCGLVCVVTFVDF